MPVSRDASNDYFLRLPPLPPYNCNQLPNNDPTHWITTAHLSHGDYDPSYKIMVTVGSSFCDILYPGVDRVEKLGATSLLGHQIIKHTVPDRSVDSSFGHSRSPIPGYQIWAQHILRTHRAVLQSAGVYKAVCASLFDNASVPLLLAQVLTEHWDTHANSCWVGPYELVIALHELQMVSGLPILDRPYDECAPSEDVLLLSPEKSVYPGSLLTALSYFRSLHSALYPSSRMTEALPLVDWVRSFVAAEIESGFQFCPSDPLSVGLRSSSMDDEAFFEFSSAYHNTSTVGPGVDDQTSIIGFIAAWLCHFVLPDDRGTLRVNVLLVASLIARGDRISLAPAILARIYRSLN